MAKGMRSVCASIGGFLVSTVIILIATVPGESRAEAETARWPWPIDAPHAVLRTFYMTENPYASGHRGIDIAAHVGHSVAGPSDGMITFTGTVVDRPLLTIEHSPGVLWTIEPVASRLALGTYVKQGESVGVVATGGHCSQTCIHMGIRQDGTYTNPLEFLELLPRAVLLPPTQPNRAPHINPSSFSGLRCCPKTKRAA